MVSHMPADNKDSLRTKESFGCDFISKVKFERLSINGEEEYLNFLMSAYKDLPIWRRFKGKEAVRRFWRWEYMEGPVVDSRNPFIWICRFNGEIIGQFCLMIVELKIGDRIFKAGWCQHFIVLSQFRNIGIGHALVAHVLKEVGGVLDILLAAGTNRASYNLFKKAGFIDMGFISCNVWPLNFRNIARTVMRNAYLQITLDIALRLLAGAMLFLKSSYQKYTTQILEVRDFAEEFDIFWQDISKRLGCIVKRDSMNLRWRFVLQPDRDYKILIAKSGTLIKGYIILREAVFRRDALRNLKIGVVSDILFDPKDRQAGLSLLSAAFNYFRGRVDLLRCDILNFDIKKLVKSTPFIPLKSKNRFLIYLLNNNSITAEKEWILNNRKSWYLTYGDSDLDLL